MKKNLNKVILSAIKKGYKRAFETAVRTGTALVVERDGKIVKVKPPYRYKLVPIKSRKKSS